MSCPLDCTSDSHSKAGNDYSPLYSVEYTAVGTRCHHAQCRHLDISLIRACTNYEIDRKIYKSSSFIFDDDHCDIYYSRCESDRLTATYCSCRRHTRPPPDSACACCGCVNVRVHALTWVSVCEREREIEEREQRESEIDIQRVYWWEDWHTHWGRTTFDPSGQFAPVRCIVIIFKC